MKKKYLLRRTWLVHESGSKFHQSFEIAQTGAGPGVTIFHFGKQYDKSSFKRPINGGQIQIKSAGRYYSQINKKKSEGYSTQPGEVERELSFDSSDEFIGFLRIEFGTVKAAEIISRMSILTMQDSEEQPEEVREDKPVDKFAGRPAAWGSW